MVQSQQPAVVSEVVIDKDVQEEVTGVDSADFFSHKSINYVNISIINIVLHIIKLYCSISCAISVMSLRGTKRKGEMD